MTVESDMFFQKTIRTERENYEHPCKKNRFELGNDSHLSAVIDLKREKRKRETDRLKTLKARGEGKIRK